MSALAAIRPGDRVKFRRFHGLPNQQGIRDSSEAWGTVKLRNRDGSIVLDAGGRHGRPHVIHSDEHVLAVRPAR